MFAALAKVAAGRSASADHVRLAHFLHAPSLGTSIGATGAQQAAGPFDTTDRRKFRRGATRSYDGTARGAPRQSGGRRTLERCMEHITAKQEMVVIETPRSWSQGSRSSTF